MLSLQSLQRKHNTINAVGADSCFFMKVLGEKQVDKYGDEEDKPIMNGRSSLHQDTVTSPSGLFGRFKVSKRTREHNEVWLGGDEVEYVKTNLKPGSRYQIELRSMTGGQFIHKISI